MAEQTWAQRFALNAETKLKSGSTYVVGFGLGFLALLAAWPDLASALDKVPVLHGYGAPIAILIGALVTMFRPSTAISSTLETALIELARVKANAVLKDAGSDKQIPQSPAVAGLPQVPMQVVIAGLHEEAVNTVPSSDVKQVPPWAQPGPDLATASITPTPVDIEIPTVASTLPSSVPLPIDPKLLLSLVKEYLSQQVK